MNIIFSTCLLAAILAPGSGKLNPVNEKCLNVNPDKNGIELTISNIRNKTGLIQIGVFDSEDGYPDKPRFSFTLAKDTILSGEMHLFIPLSQPRPIGITVLDDENRNGKMDMWLGIKPKEGFGFSNNPRVPGRKAPPYSETWIDFAGGRKAVLIRMKYI